MKWLTSKPFSDGPIRTTGRIVGTTSYMATCSPYSHKNTRLTQVSAVKWRVEMAGMSFLDTLLKKDSLCWSFFGTGISRLALFIDNWWTGWSHQENQLGVMSRMSSFTHAASVRTACVRDAFTHVGTLWGWTCSLISITHVRFASSPLYSLCRGCRWRQKLSSTTQLIAQSKRPVLSVLQSLFNKQYKMNARWRCVSVAPLLPLIAHSCEQLHANGVCGSAVTVLKRIKVNKYDSDRILLCCSMWTSQTKVGETEEGKYFSFNASFAVCSTGYNTGPVCWWPLNLQTGPLTNKRHGCEILLVGHGGWNLWV